MVGLGDIALGVGRSVAAPDTIANIIDFVESPWGLNIKPYPVQRIILKAHYGIPLDDTDQSVHISDWKRQNWLHMTEAEYLRYLYDNQRCNIREVVKGQELREMVLSIGRRSGKCVVGDSLVLTDTGIHRIESLGDPEGPEVQPLDIGVAQEGAVQSRSAYFYNGGVKATRTLVTQCGYRLGGTDNHRIKVLSEQGTVKWKYLADLKVGDTVCIHRNTNLWAPDYVDCIPFHNDKGLRGLTFPDTLTEEWGRLLGYLVGDGLWNYKGRVEVTVEHDETWECLKALYTKLLGSYSVVMDKRRENTGSIKFGSVGMRAFLHDLGFQLGTDRDAKMVPWSILQSPRPVVQAFLRGLFETDGGVEKDGQVVSFSTASGRLAREVQTLLLNLGIVSRIKPKTIKGRVYWLLTIRGLRHRTAFAERVGFDSLKKMEPLLASLQAGKEGGDAESIPHQRQWCRRLLESVPKGSRHTGTGWERSELRAVLGNTIKASSSDDVTYSRIGKALPVARQLGADSDAIAHFEHLVHLDYFFDPVVEIEEGVDPVFDLNVPDGESFVANGMTNHNTFLAACIAAYETYKLILKQCPQEYYGIAKTNVIQIISVATDEKQAGLLYTEASGHFTTCGYFAPFTANHTQSEAKFQTPFDIERYGRWEDNKGANSTIKVTFRSCIAKGLRGAGNMVIILDELAHFTDGGQSSADKVYDAIKPSASAFSPKDPNDSTIPIGEVEGRVISISSPLGKQGQFYDLFQTAMGGGLAGEGMLAIQAPTWEVNPTIEGKWLAKEYVKNPTVFFTEYGGEFTDRTRGWIEREADLMECVDPDRRPVQTAPARRPHFIGIDLGLVGDGTAVAIGHITPDKQIVLDYLEQIKAGEGDYINYDRLEFDDVAEWIFQLSRRFYLAEGIFDQWSGIPFEQALLKKGLRQLKAEHMTKPLNSQIFQNFKAMMWDKRIELYDWPIPEDAKEGLHCPYITELLELQAEFQSKYVTIVSAPNVKGKHDDRPDALVRMVWLASQALSKPKYIAKGTGVGKTSLLGQHANDIAYRKALMKSRRMGTSPDRQRSTVVRGKIKGRY